MDGERESYGLVGQPYGPPQPEHERKPLDIVCENFERQCQSNPSSDICIQGTLLCEILKLSRPW